MSPPATGSLSLQGLTKRYGDSKVVDGVDLEVGAGELVALVGASGCGKTTTLKMINRLVLPSAGRVLLDGQDTTAVPPTQLRRGIGWVMQAGGLFPHRTVAENVATVPRLLGWPAQRIRARVDSLLELVRLPPGVFRDRYPHALSGGQRQRVGVARALAGEPSLLLMDEPFGALDPVTRAELQAELSRLHRELGLTIVLVTHDMAEALTLADRVAVMHAGSLVSVAPPAALWRDPGHPAVAALLETPRRQAAELAALDNR